MKKEITQIRRTLGLLSSMIKIGERHDECSEEALSKAINGLWEIGKFFETSECKQALQEVEYKKYIPASEN